MKTIKTILKFVDENKLYPDLQTINGSVDTIIQIDGKDKVMFGSNNYLGLATHPKLKSVAIKAVEDVGVGSDGSRLLSGNLALHKELEEKIASFKKGPAAIVWPTGYSANVGVISAFANPIKVRPSDFFSRKTVVISDELNHASIVDGIKLAGADKAIYRHNDMNDLKSVLHKNKNRRNLIVTDGVFSMDGDIAPLDKIVPLAKEYGASVMVDDAHGTGILGPTGKGTLEHFGLEPVKDVDIVLGTFSKALAGTGGFVVGSEDLVRYLRIASRSYMFSTAMTPAASASLIVALQILEEEPNRREQLTANTVWLRNALHELGFYTCGSVTQIVPILIGKDEDAINFSRELNSLGYYVPAVRWPAVPKNMARLRISVMATHTQDQLNGMIHSCKKVLSSMNFIPPKPSI
jgi:8-amino-7-oxononanoate synthase